MIHNNVKRIREAKGVTKTHIAKKLKMSPMGYTHIESGKVRLDVERLRLIAVILGVSPEIFFDNELTESVIERINSTAKEVS